MGMRPSIPEAKSFVVLIRQSKESGTRLVQSVSVYREEIRQKRLSRAEEKSNSLPVKLVLLLRSSTSRCCLA
jgi:tight adherence protein C